MREPSRTFEPGQLVRSIAGRDHGMYYLVFKAKGREVLLVDGRRRLPENAKAKNICHVQATKQVSAEFAAKAAAGRLTPENIRAALASLLRNDPDEEAETQDV